MSVVELQKKESNMTEFADDFKNFIMSLVYPSKDAQKFVYEDICVPLEKIISDDMIFGSQFQDSATHTQTLSLIKISIANFLDENMFLLDYFKEIYPKFMFDDICFWILVGFVLYRADKTNRLSDLNIVDEKSCVLTFDEDILQKAKLITF